MVVARTHALDDDPGVAQAGKRWEQPPVRYRIDRGHPVMRALLHAGCSQTKRLVELAEFHVGDVPAVKQLAQEVQRAALALKVEQTAATVGKGVQP